MTSDAIAFHVLEIKRFFAQIHEDVMNIQEAKDIRLVDFLAGFGYEPVIQRGNSVWYKSPFRAEKKASFKVDLHKELWYDFGLAMRVLIISFQCITCIAY